MYTPPAFRDDDLASAHATIRAAGLAHLVTATQHGPLATPLPLYLVPDEGPYGTLYGHMARANDQWKTPVTGEALAIFAGPDFYVTPSWYATKQQTGKVVPTWNYIAVHAHGAPEFFDDPDRLRAAVTHLTDLHENARPDPWAVTDAPEDFIRSQLRGIVGLRMEITRLTAKRKLSQNRPEADRQGVRTGMEQDPALRALIPLVPE